VDADPPYACSAERAIVERLLRASVDTHGALALVREQRTARLLRLAIDCLDESIKQVQGIALDAQCNPRPARPGAGALTGRVRRRRARLARSAARMALASR